MYVYVCANERIFFIFFFFPKIKQGGVDGRRGCEGVREIDRQTDSQRDRQKIRGGDRDRHIKERERERERDRQTDGDKDRERYR